MEVEADDPLALLLLAGWVILILLYGILPGIGVAILIVDALPRSQKLRIRVGLAIPLAVGFAIFAVYSQP